MLELDKPDQFSLGQKLQIGDKTYKDLDELIVDHISHMARNVQAMMNHEKYIGDKDQLGEW